MAAERIAMESKVLLSPKDLETIKSQIKAEVIKELTNKDFHTHMEHDPFNEVRRKYAQYGGPLSQAWNNTYGWAQAWEHIRRLSVMCVGIQYVRDLTPEKSTKAADIAEFLCKLVIQKRREENG